MMKWSYGITTVPSRSQDLLPKTLSSLSDAGFSNPRLFVDGWSISADYDITYRMPRVGTMGNWILSLWELYLRNPHADRYAIFQDDIIACRGLRSYLDSCKYPRIGYWNLYTHRDNVDAVETGWIESRQKAIGAVALVFNRECVVQLLSSRHLVKRPQDSGRYSKVRMAVDRMVREAARPFKEYIHFPSLVQHVGRLSEMRHDFMKSDYFTGEIR